MKMMAERASWVDSLLTGDELVGKLADARLNGPDGAASPGPGDQTIARTVIDFLKERSRGHLVIQLPRGANDVALLCGLTVQLTRSAELRSQNFDSMAAFSGPVVVVGTDTAVQRRLRTIDLKGARFGGGLAEGLSACRVRADGDVVTATDQILPVDAVDRPLLYLNTRVGWPEISVHDGVGILDRTSLSPDAYKAALGWITRRASRVITISDLGDPITWDILEESGVSAEAFQLTPAVVDDIFYVLGTGQGVTSLSTNPLFSRGPERRPAWNPDFEIELIDHDEISEIIRSAFGALAAAPSGGRPPYLFRAASQLLSILIRCPTGIADYAQAAALDYPRTKPPRPLADVVERRQPDFHGPWRAFAATHWAGLRQAVLSLYRLVGENNPKADRLMFAVDRLRREHPSARIRVRTPNSVSVPVTKRALEGAGLLDGRIEVESMSARTPWMSADIEVWVGTPSWAQLAHILGAESPAKVGVLYTAEASLLTRRTEQLLERINKLQDDFKATHELSDVPHDQVEWRFRTPVRPTIRFVDPSVDFDRIVERASELMSGIDDEAREVGSERTAGELARLIPLRFEDGTIWWVDPERAVGSVVNGKYHHVLVTELRPGDQVVVPRGEGRDEIFSRLVQAARGAGDMRELDILLGRFRSACLKLWKTCGENWVAVRRRLEEAGAHATTQCRAWAQGTTIAPEEPRDVRLIGELVGDSRLVEGWAAVASVAQEIRRVHQRLGHAISNALSEVLEGTIGPNIRKIQDLLGDDAVEALDEFAVKRLEDIGAKQDVDARYEGQVMHGVIG